MHMVVNRIPIRPDADWDDFARRVDAFAAETRPDHPELLSMQVMRSKRRVGNSCPPSDAPARSDR